MGGNDEGCQLIDSKCLLKLSVVCHYQRLCIDTRIIHQYFEIQILTLTNRFDFLGQSFTLVYRGKISLEGIYVNTGSIVLFVSPLLYVLSDRIASCRDTFRISSMDQYIVAFGGQILGGRHTNPIRRTRNQGRWAMDLVIFSIICESVDFGKCTRTATTNNDDDV